MTRDTGAEDPERTAFEPSGRGRRPDGGGSNRQPEREVGIDPILEALANWRRRALLQYLREREAHRTTIDELTEHLQEREADATTDRPVGDTVEVSLLHVHLPKLADVGVLEYDERSRNVRYLGEKRLETWLDRIRAETNG